MTVPITQAQRGRRAPPRRRCRKARLRWLAVLTVVLTACSSQIDSIEIPAQDPELVTTGGELYAVHCAECHGSDLRGTDRGPSHLSIIYEPNHHADGAFVFAIQGGSRAHHWGFGNMPPIEGLSAADIEAIIAFVRETQRLEGFEPYPP